MKLLDELSRLHEAGTKGPWEWEHLGINVSDQTFYICTDKNNNAVLDGTNDCYGDCGVLVSKENAALIVAARNALPLLIEALKMQDEALEAQPECEVHTCHAPNAFSDEEDPCTCGYETARATRAKVQKLLEGETK